jgi:hypothetical protein
MISKTGFSLFSLLLLGALSLEACGEIYRFEPLMLENQVIASQVVSRYDDHALISSCEQLVKQFVQHLKDDDCNSAWGLLGNRYRSNFAAVAGSDETARSQFCEGYKVQDEMLVKGDWVDFLMGSRAYYLTTVPPELEMVKSGQEDLLYVVQRDGTYRALLFIKEDGTRKIEPF